MPDPQHAPFRQCICPAPDCGRVFYICRSCERGQVYCGAVCRRLARRIQHRDANRRHQQSEEGRLDHQDRSRAWRERQAAARVTDHTYAPTPSYATMPEPAPVVPHRPLSPNSPALWRSSRPFDSTCRGIACHFCGRRGRFLNPFHERN